MLYINSDRLHIELAHPGETPNDNSRFDRAGTITEIVLDKKYRFCASEPFNLSHPCSGGRGLTNEYKLDVCDETAVGEKHPKLGVGLLTKPDEAPYRFFKQYETEAYPVYWNQTEDSITFLTEPIPCQGYAVRQVKTIKVSGNEITMTVKLTNVGEKEINTQEYCHNFLTINSMAIGPNYKLHMPELEDQGDQEFTPTLKGDGKGLVFTGYPARASHKTIDASELTSEERFSWKLEHTGAGAYVECVDHFKPENVVLWYVDHMICVEAFHGISIKPGETDEWVRTWKFDVL